MSDDSGDKTKHDSFVEKQKRLNQNVSTRTKTIIVLLFGCL
jgi:uncharacterized protein YhbP (UPF0306 family)